LSTQHLQVLWRNEVKDRPVEKIRNFVLVGHTGVGKTTLADCMVHKAGVTNRKGSVDQGTAVPDFRPEEQERKGSIYSAALNCDWAESHFFFLDTPGYIDFAGEASASQEIADIALVVVDTASKIDTGTIRAMKQAKALNQPRAFFVNGLDRDQADFAEVLAVLQKSYGATTCIPFNIPVGEQSGFSAVASVFKPESAPESVRAQVDKYREMLMDTVAESDEALMNKYLEGEELSDAEIARGLHAAIIGGSLMPVFAGSAEQDIGITELMNGIANFFPAPLAGRVLPLKDGELQLQQEKTALARVFKSVADPFIGQLTFFRVYSGTFKSDSEAYNVTRSHKERWGSLLVVNGKDQTPVAEAGPGDIVAVAKLKDTHINDTLSTDSHVHKQFAPIVFPNPTISYAIFPVKSGEEEKIASGLTRLIEEDPTIHLERNAETHQTVLSGMGDQHLHNVINRLKTTFKVEVDLQTPKVPYRETITGTGQAMYRHKKQTGGHGQFAEVHLRLEPLPQTEAGEENFEFANEVVGGNIPRNFIPAVEKGVVESMVKGPLAHCKVINIKAVVFDGKYHPVDSSEMAFKIASRGAFRESMKGAKPMLLEPVMKVKIMFPEEYMGDISGDLNSRRGRILGMDREDGLQVVFAEAPQAELYTYSTQLRSMTQGRGTFELHFDRYDTVPAALAQQIQAAVAKEEEEE